MPRDLPIGNGQLLINFDADYRIRDIYYPFVGKENHAGGYPFRFGVMVGKQFRWVGRGDGWELELAYEPDTLITCVKLTHQELGVTLTVRDCVDFHETIFLRQIHITNHRDAAAEVRLFFHQDFRISESEIGDTAAYDPRNRTMVHYKGERYFLMNVMVDGRAGVDHYAIGQKGAPGRDGTWRDAEDDGILSGNPISQGAVDSTIAAHTLIPGGGGEKVVYYWMVVAQAWAGRWNALHEVNAKLVERGPASFIERTRSYWRLWVRKEPIDYADLAPTLSDLYRRSLLILRTQIDNHGAIIAANDSDVTQFNRDTYSYLWPRDGALVAHALDLAGYPEIALRFFTFCADVITDEGFLLHKYNPDKSLASSWHPWTVGGPVAAADSGRRDRAGRLGAVEALPALPRSGVGEAAIRTPGAQGGGVHGPLPRAAHRPAVAVLRSVGRAARHPVIYLRVGVRRPARRRRVRPQLRRAR